MNACFGDLRRSDRGEGMMVSLYSMLLVTIVLMIGIEAAGYSTTVWKLRQVCTETLNLMKVVSGFDYQVESYFVELLRSYGLEALNPELQGTPKYVQRGELLELQAHGSYSLHCLRPFGTKLQVPLHIRVRGLSHTYLRDD